MRWLDWLKRFLGLPGKPRHNYLESGRLFPELDVEGLKGRLSLHEQGTARGTRNESPSTQTTFDEIENQIVSECESALADSQESLTSYLRSYSDRFANLSIGSRAAALEAASTTATSEFHGHVSDGKDVLFQLRRAVADARRDLDNFRQHHALRRAAQHPLHRVFNVGVLAVLVLIESFANGALLARGNPLGFLGGVSQALIIAVFNVAVGCSFGRIGVPNLSHRSLTCLAIFGPADA